jgi:hypothetical protein
MHDVVDRQLGKGRVVHEREGHGVERDVDATRVCRHGIGVFRDGALVERVDLGHAGGVADVFRDLLEPGHRPPGEVDAGAGSRKCMGNGAADRPAAAIDRRGLVLQHHRGLLRSSGEHARRRCRPTASRKWAGGAALVAAWTCRCRERRSYGR